MRKTILSILKFISKISPSFNCCHIRLRMLSGIPIGVVLVNYIFQRIFGINNEADIPVHFTSKVTGFERINFVKDRTTIQSFAVSGGCYIQGFNGIAIGKNFLFAPGVKIISSNHHFDDYSLKAPSPPIVIGENVWIGTNAVILPGVQIGNNAIIAAGAVVTKSFSEDNVIIAGNPAKVIRRR